MDYLYFNSHNSTENICLAAEIAKDIQSDAYMYVYTMAQQFGMPLLEESESVQHYKPSNAR